MEYEINVFNDTHINVEGVYCWADIVFDKDTENLNTWEQRNKMSVS